MGIVERIRNWFKRPPARVEAGKCGGCSQPVENDDAIRFDDGRVFHDISCVWQAKAIQVRKLAVRK